MKNSKLIETLASLSHRELLRFKTFVETPYFNKQPDCIRLLKALSTFAPEYDGIGLEKELIYARMFPDASYRAQHMREIMAHLNRLLRQYIAMEQWKATPYAIELAALEAFQQRGLSSVFNKELTAVRKRLETGTELESDFYFTRFQLARLANLHFGSQQQRKQDTNLADKVSALDHWYLYVRLMESCEMLNRNRLSGTQYDPGMIEELDNYLQSQPAVLRDVPAIGIYYQVLCLLRSEAQADYEHLVSLLDAASHHFHPGEARNLYKHAQNYCIRQINAGQTAFTTKLFTLYKRLLENELILVDGEIAHTDYKNIVTVGIRHGDTEWVAGFIEHYKDQVAEPHRENVYNFSLANLYVETGRYGAAIRLLHAVTFTDTLYQVSARLLLLRAYYESEDTEAGFYQVEALKLYLKRNKQLAAKTRENHLRFLRFYKRLLQLREQQFFMKQSLFQTRIDKVLQQFEATSGISNRKWLAEKMSDLQETG